MSRPSAHSIPVRWSEPVLASPVPAARGGSSTTAHATPASPQPPSPVDGSHGPGGVVTVARLLVSSGASSTVVTVNVTDLPTASEGIFHVSLPAEAVESGLVLITRSPFGRRSLTVASTASIWPSLVTTIV